MRSCRFPVFFSPILKFTRNNQLSSRMWGEGEGGAEAL
jgi:hypothetical protein